MVTPESLQWFGETDRGKVRANNEDAFLGLRFDAHEILRLGKFGEAPIGNMDFVFAVSDGMGGAKAGEYASRITIDKITTLLPRSFPHMAEGLAAGYEDVLTELFGEIHSALTYVGSSYPECAEMQATLSLCWLTPHWLYFAHIGDSRIYYQSERAGGIKRLTQDDTHVDWLYRNGQLNEREARSHPRRNMLQKALGGDNQFVNPQFGAVAYEPGDIFVLCTDGLVEGLYDEQIVEQLRSAEPGSPAHRLVKESVEKCGRDNTTALVIQMA